MSTIIRLTPVELENKNKNWMMTSRPAAAHKRRLIDYRLPVLVQFLDVQVLYRQQSDDVRSQTYMYCTVLVLSRSTVLTCTVLVLASTVI